MAPVDHAHIKAHELEITCGPREVVGYTVHHFLVHLIDRYTVLPHVARRPYWIFSAHDIFRVIGRP